MTHPFDVSGFDNLVESLAVERGLAAGLVDNLLAARRTHARAGNRRPLFAEFDRLLDAPATQGPGTPSTAAVNGKRFPIAIKALHLRNWKIFDDVRIEFPTFNDAQPVVLIGGKNGFGKTSILEGLLYGLFGRRARQEVDKLLWVETGQDSPASIRDAYRAAIEQAFHVPARVGGDGVSTVVIEFETGSGPLTVERRWYFDADGRFVEEDEELILREGEDTHLVEVPADTDINEYYQDEIARRILAPSLAPFFFFDGEQIKRLGERGLAEQMRLGIESVLGIYRLRETAADLRAYLRDRVKDSDADRTVDRLAADLQALVAEEEQVTAEIALNEQQRAPLRKRRDGILQQLGMISGGTFADLQLLLEQRRQIEGQQSQLEAALAAVVANELPGALLGAPMLARVRATLREEEVAEATMVGKGVFGDIDAFLRNFDAIKPPLAKAERGKMHDRIREAWSARDSVPTLIELRHQHLIGRPRQGSLDRLDQMARCDINAAASLSRELDRLTVEHAAVTAEIDRRRELENEEPQLRQALDETARALDLVVDQRRALDQRLGEVRARLTPKRAEYDRRASRGRAGARHDARSERAALVIETIEAAIDQGAPSYFERFALLVSDNYRVLAHKGTVGAIRLNPDGNVVLVDRNGKNIEGVAPSAGESQIFAMALVAAVADVTEFILPIVVDTPLGRLDSDHRERMLRHFAARSGQTVLLSQPDEVNGRYLSLIEERVGAYFHLDHRIESGRASHSVAERGYFPNMAA